jgi:hypothetical protein
MNALPPLTNGYFDGDLQPSEYATLRNWLLESDEHVNDFVVDSFVHTQLIELLGPEQVRANALVAAEFNPKADGRLGTRRLSGRLLLLAAMLVVAFPLAYFVMLRSEVVGTVTGTRNVKWAFGAEKRTVGSLLQAGDEVALNVGTLYLTLARGGQIALHGPAKFRVDSDNAGRLLNGRLSAFVPEHAVGFTVRSGKLTFVDLGTEFRLEMLSENTGELQVFDGLVEVQFDDRAGAKSAELQISQGRAVRLDAVTSDVKSIEYDKTMRLPMTEWSQ